jgi:hypothetical protein
MAAERAVVHTRQQGSPAPAGCPKYPPGPPSPGAAAKAHIWIAAELRLGLIMSLFFSMVLGLPPSLQPTAPLTLHTCTRGAEQAAHATTRRVGGQDAEAGRGSHAA